MITADCHLHSRFSGDSDASMEEMIRRGLALGLESMCFTEHNDFDYPSAPEEPEGLFLLDAEGYRKAFLRQKEKYRNIRLLFGVELGMQPHLAAENAAFVRRFPFDFVIASSHVCGGKDPYYPSFFAGRTEEEAYREYFSSILENLQSFSDFDVYGHLDYIVRYGPGKDRDYSYQKYQDLFDPILTRLIGMGKGIELNTGAAGSGLRELHPCTDVLKRYQSLGGEIVTIGSDAHAPERIAAAFDRAAAVLTECGFRYYCVFSERKPEFLPL